MLFNKNELERGFTLVEELAVIVILVVTMFIIVPVFTGEIDEAKKEVCDTNRAIVEKDYEMYLMLMSEDHSDTLFTSYLVNFEGVLCPDNGVFSCRNGGLNCSEHSQVEKNEKEVPWL